MIDVVVPEVGEVGMEVTFVAWLREEGDVVKAGELLFQLDTQKTTLDVEAVGTGRLTHLAVAPGDLVEARQVIARLLAADELDRDMATAGGADPATHASVPRGDADAAHHPAGAGAAGDTAPPSPGASPRAKRVARDLGIDLATVSGTGDGGMVTEADVRARASATAVQAAGSPVADGQDLDERREQTRRAVAAMTSASWRSVPHFYLSLVADLTRGLDRARPMTLICAAVARALVDHPECNLEWSDERPIRRSTVDLGILVDTPVGLLLPVVRSADALTAHDLRAAIEAAAIRARQRLLRTDDFGIRSLSVSNLGMFSVDQFDGVIAAPDPMLLTIGRTRIEPTWDGSGWLPRTVATLTLAVDHRALDGAAAARFLSTLERLLNDPGWLV